MEKAIRASDPFHVDEGGVTVQSCATVIILRRRPGATPVERVSRSSFAELFSPSTKTPKLRIDHPILQVVLASGIPYEFVNGWEVLMGQNEVINFLKSTPEKLTTQRYAGEFKVAGGNQDDDESLVQCARRELYEEFIRPLGLKASAEEVNSIKLHPFSVKQTLPVRSRSSMMHNFICLASENPLFASLDGEILDNLNAQLASRSDAFLKGMLSGELRDYAKMSIEERELIAPEVHRLEWLSLGTAVKYALSSMIKGCYVNDWQRQQFETMAASNGGRCKVRDPMFVTAATMIEIEKFGTEGQLVDYCEHIETTDPEMDVLRRREQWLQPGAGNDEVSKIMWEKISGVGDPGILTAEQLGASRMTARL